MPDITMCLNHHCTRRTDCYRYTAIPSHFQSYSEFYQARDGTCDHYWINDEAAKRDFRELV